MPLPHQQCPATSPSPCPISTMPLMEQSTATCSGTSGSPSGAGLGCAGPEAPLSIRGFACPREAKGFCVYVWVAFPSRRPKPAE